eukprot:g16643.t1
MPATLAALAIYLISLSSPTPGAATTSAVSASARQPDVDVDLGQPRRGGGIGGKGQQGTTIDSSWVERSEEEVVRARRQGISGKEGGLPRIPDWNADAHQLRPLLNGGSSRDGADEDEQTWLQPGHSIDGVGHSSSKEANSPPPVSGEAARDDPAREVEDKIGGRDGACSTSGVGGGSDNDRWAAQTVGMQAPRPRQLPSQQHSSCSGAVKTIGGTVPDVLEDSAWCVGGEDCGLPRAEVADDGHDEALGARAGLDGGASPSIKTVGGTVPDVLEGSAWCAREEGCAVHPPAGVTRDDGRTEGVAGGSNGRVGSSAASVYGGGLYWGGVDGEVEARWRLQAAAGAGGKESIPAGQDDGVRDGGALEQPTGKAAKGFSDKHAGGRTTDAAAAAAAAAASAQFDPHLDGKGVPTEADVYPFSYSRPASSKQQSAPTVAPTPHDVAAEQPPLLQERRGPLVKGEGVNTNTDPGRRVKADSAAPATGRGDVGEPAKNYVGEVDGKDPDRRSRGGAGAGAGKDRWSRGRDLTIETAEESVGEGEEEEEESFGRVTAADWGRWWSSWRRFACALLVCAVVFGTYLRGTLPSWVPLPFLGRDPREAWAIDLDSAIANARSRASSFCSGRASVFSEDPVDDSDLPELVSDHEGDSGGSGEGDRGGDADGEAPLMWDTRPKPDDYLVFHPVLGVVPAGAIRAWGGDGRGGWSGDGKVERNGRAGAAAGMRTEVRAVERKGVNGGHGAEGVTGGRSIEPRCSPRRGIEGGKGVKAGGGGERKRLPPVRNTDEWFEWVAARETTAAAAANAPDEASPAATVHIEEPAMPALIPPDGAGAGAGANEVAGGCGPIDGGREKERSGGGRLRPTSTTKEVTAGGSEKHPSSLSHMPAAFSLQFGVGNGSGNTCNGAGGGESKTAGGSGRPGGGVDSGSGGCSSDDGRDVRVEDFSARLSSEQPPVVTAAYHVS